MNYRIVGKMQSGRKGYRTYKIQYRSCFIWFDLNSRIYFELAYAQRALEIHLDSEKFTWWETVLRYRGD